MRASKPYKRTYKKTAKKGLTPVQKKQVKTIIAKDIETKVYQSSIAPIAITNTGVIYPLTSIIQSVANDGRVGDEIQLEKCTFNFDCIASQAALGSWLAGDAYNNLRVIIFRWYENSLNYSPVVADVINTGLLSYTYLAPYNYDSINEGSLHVCYDKTFILENTPYWNGSTTLFASGQSSIHNDLNHQLYGRKLGKKKVIFNDALLTGSNQLFILLVSDSAATPHPYAQWNSTIHYTDA